MQANEDRPLQLFSKDKLEEFREMTLEARLGWLEEANAFVMRLHGWKKRGETDGRFKGWPEE